MKEKYIAPVLGIEVFITNAIIAASPAMSDFFTTGTDYTWDGKEYVE